MSAQLEAAALRLLRAGRGQRVSVAQEIAAELGVSPATVYNRLKPFLPNKQRKRRSDAGDTALTRAEALLISATIRETRRETETGASPLEVAVKHLRANGEILAGRVDETTGEFRPLSISAIGRGLRRWGLHPEQVNVSSPASRLSSPHPNHCWQIDASVSRQFYLADDGTREMPIREFYRGKPGNLVKINDQRLWRYVLTDHASGALEIFYVQGAESANNFLAAFIFAMQEREDGTMFGRPVYLMSDPGSAVTSQPVKNLCAAIGTTLIVNEAGNARAKGQVENAHYIVETHFESMLKMRGPVTSVEEINRLAWAWARDFNATRIHSRTGETRRDGWLAITPEQLVRVEGIAALSRLANTDPKTCTVRDCMIRFSGRVYDVRDLPGGVLNGQRLQVVRNALDRDQASVRVLIKDAEGQPAHYLAPEITKAAHGFLSTAAEIGSAFRSPPKSSADAARDELDRVAMEVTTAEEVKAARKARRVPFGGRIDPTKAMQREYPTTLPRAGRTADIAVPAHVEPEAVPYIRPQYAPRLLGHVELARLLKPRIEATGGTWTAVHYQRLVEGWPQGAAEEQLDDVCAALMRSGLRIAGGAA
jgi:hypothetical protein